nr:PB1 domain, zinc finger, ZZ-type, UBA-like, next to BRCA1, central domain protein [Tanacetum cinerariifolium]
MYSPQSRAMSSCSSRTPTVIKVKYGEALRRFRASIDYSRLAFDIVMLKEKIRSLFSLGSDVEFTMTYVDEDGDVIILADDNDLRDIALQTSLNPLRITVELNKNGNPSRSNETSVSQVSDLVEKMKTTFLNQINGVKSELSTVKDSNVPHFQFESVKAPINVSVTLDVDESTRKKKDSKKVEVNNEVGSMFHKGVCCDRCGVHPTTSKPSLKSKVKEYYDVCRDCFSKLQGSLADYIKIDDQPITGFSYHMSPLKGLHDLVDASMKNMSETLVDLNFPPFVKYPEVVNDDHLMDNVLPGNNVTKVSDSEDLTVNSSRKEQKNNFDLNDSFSDTDDEPSTMDALSGPAVPAEFKSTLDSAPAGPEASSALYPTLELGTSFLEPVSFPTINMISGVSSSTVDVGQSSGSGTEDVSDEVDYGHLDKKFDVLCEDLDWDSMQDDLQEMGFAEMQ